MKYLFLPCLLLLMPAMVHAKSDTLNKKVYRLHLEYELPGSVLFMGISYFGFRELDKVSTFDAEDIAKLNINKINSFDRPVAYYDPAGFAQAQKHSDLFLNISIASPVILLLDKNIRKDWLDLLSLYLVTHAADNVVYFATAFPIRRARPFTYNTNIPLERRIGEAKSNSFFSGHVSFSATSTFFLAKVYTDYHQIKGWKRLVIYTAATIPPALVGYYRMHAGKHFKTDVMLGMAVGASSGILIPELHRKMKHHKHISMQPYFSPTGAGGLSFKVTF